MHLTVIPADKAIYLETSTIIWPNRVCHIINDDSFWSSIDPTIHAIQYHDNDVQEIEYEVKSGKGNVSITNVADLQIYVDRFNQQESLYQSQVAAQQAWINNNVQGETPAQKIARLGAMPTISAT